MTYFSTPPNDDDLLQLAQAALASLPPLFAQHVQGLTIVVDEVADDDVLAELDVENPWEITGIYRSAASAKRASLPGAEHLQDTIHLYREPILIEWVESGEDLGLLVASILVHEIAHHFDISEEEIERAELLHDRDQVH